MLRTLILAGLLLSGPLASAQQPPVTDFDAQPYVDADARAVDLVLVLDTSGSMKKLLDEVRYRLWEVVNEFSGLQPTPVLRVGLLTFGSIEGGADGGWIVTHTNLTRDLDVAYSKLMNLKTTGHAEFVGWALNNAVDSMNWSEDPEALKIIFVAGNESADQGSEYHNFRDVAADARNLDIIINAIYAGHSGQGIQMGWQELAGQGSGEFLAVAKPVVTPQTIAPQDAMLEELNAELNGTYVPFGARGAEGRANLEAQDANAAKLGASSSRIVTKGSSLYNHASWDLVDATQRLDFDWNGLTEDNLPEELRGSSEADLMSFIEQKRAERESIRQQIQQLGAERVHYLRSELGDAYRPAAGVAGAMKESVRKQAKEKGFGREE